MPSDDIKIRTPKVGEADKLAELINAFAKNNLMLERSVENVISNIRNFIVAEANGKIIACCAISFFSTELAEIRSVAVDASLQKKGIGKMLIAYAEGILRDEGVKRSFVLHKLSVFNGM